MSTVNIAGPAPGELVPRARVTGTGVVHASVTTRFIVGSVIGFKTGLQGAGLDVMTAPTRADPTWVGTDMDVVELFPARHVEMRTGWAALVLGIISGDGAGGSRLSLLYRGFTDALVGTSATGRGTVSTLFGPLYVRFSRFGLDIFPDTTDNAVRVGMFYDDRALTGLSDMTATPGAEEVTRLVYFNGMGGF